MGLLLEISHFNSWALVSSYCSSDSFWTEFLTVTDRSDWTICDRLVPLALHLGQFLFADFPHPNLYLAEIWQQPGSDLAVICHCYFRFWFVNASIKSLFMKISEHFSTEIWENYSFQIDTELYVVYVILFGIY